MFSRARTYWPRGHAISGAELKKIDDNSSKAVDGHGGGSYAPTGTIVIAGAGMVATTRWKILDNAKIAVADDESLVFGAMTDGEGFKLDTGHAGRSRELIRHFDQALRSPASPLPTTEVFLHGLRSRVPGQIFSQQLRVFDGAQLDSVALRWAVGVSHANVPTLLPRMRVLRVDVDGTVVPMRAKDATTDEDGWNVWGPRPSTGANYYDSANTKTLTYTCNQHQLVDRATCQYFAQVKDEQGAGAFSAVADGNRFYTLVAAHSQIETLALRQ